MITFSYYLIFVQSTKSVARSEWIFMSSWSRAVNNSCFLSFSSGVFCLSKSWIFQTYHEKIFDLSSLVAWKLLYVFYTFFLNWSFTIAIKFYLLQTFNYKLSSTKLKPTNVNVIILNSSCTKRWSEEWFLFWSSFFILFLSFSCFFSFFSKASTILLLVIQWCEIYKLRDYFYRFYSTCYRYHRSDWTFQFCSQ